MSTLIDPGVVAAHNAPLLRHLTNDYAHLGEQLRRAGGHGARCVAAGALGAAVGGSGGFGGDLGGLLAA
ncbi:MAG: hypothetical protein RLZZ373_1404 [Pseudomonadota bacterium]|jgi:hypothetical protein